MPASLVLLEPTITMSLCAAAYATITVRHIGLRAGVEACGALVCTARSLTEAQATRRCPDDGVSG